ncbi:MAG: cytochrome c family protein [Myxococcaceae bacterium]|nr:cytochrome c family protein [Myxococcaceae bacterium]
MRWSQSRASTAISSIVLSALAACGNDAATKPSLVPDAGAADAALSDAAWPDADAGHPLAARLSLAELQDPAVCGGCHTRQYAEWKSSMHAYASIDPVFLAMNQRGQRETDGTLGKFCVQCHAPMAVHNGLTTDGLNLATLPAKMQGVTCYYCHNVSDVGPTHANADLTLADDDIMRGSIKNAVDPGVHGVAYTEQHDSRQMKASFLCGNCHDVVNQKGFHLERTLSEYRSSVNSLESANAGADSCQGCHMNFVDHDYVADLPASSGLTLKKRDLHNHRWPAVDVALSDFPDREKQRLATQCALDRGAFVFELLNNGQGDFSISLETVAGHQMPSGTAQDRRLWLEVIAYDAQDKVLFQSGVIGDREVEEHDLTDPKHDPQLCMFRDHVENDAGVEVHMFWEASARREDTSRPLPIQTEPNANHVATCSYKTPGRVQPARLTARLLMRPVGMDVLQSLVASGDLDAGVMAEMPTFELHNTNVEWKSGNGGSLSPITPKPSPIDCTGF